MKTIIQLLVVALIINACFQAARAYWDFYQLKDEVQQQALHGTEATTSELHRRVMDLAAEKGLELEWNDVEIRREGNYTVVEFSYIDDVPLVPRVYTRQWPFGATVSALRIKPLRLDEQ